jgi:MerR family transcriptional regulator/heat shock protein HspR
VTTPNTNAVYVISVVAEIVGVHPQTLRNYERAGLLDPARTAGNTRRFSEDDLTRLRHILELTSAGINIEGVKRILILEAQLESAQSSSREALPTTTALVPVPTGTALVLHVRRPR